MHGLPGLDRRQVEATAQTLLAAAKSEGMWITLDLRIGMGDAAALVGLSAGSMRNLQAEGRAPASYRLGGHRHVRTVRIVDLAEWIEARRDD